MHGWKFTYSTIQLIIYVIVLVYAKIKYACLEVHLQHNTTHYLRYCPRLCKKLFRSRHVCIVFYRKQPIAECSNSAVHP